jgi:hypothetical protein
VAGAQYDIYLGTNAVAVSNATTKSPEYQGRSSTPGWSPPALRTNTSYFWRVDQVLPPANLTTGAVWRFSTAVDALHGGLNLHYTLDAADTIPPVTCDYAGPPFSDGLLSGSPTQVVGQVKEALNFSSAASQYAQAPALNLNAATATFAAWIRRSGNQNNYTGLLYCRGGSTLSGFNFTTGNQLGYTWNNDPNTVYFNSALVPPDGQWAWTALVVETNRAVLYLGTTNGVLQSATNFCTHVMQAFDAPLYVGSDPYGGRYFNGALDEVHVWNRALSGVEVGQVFSNGLTGISLDSALVLPNRSFTWCGTSSSGSWTTPANWTGTTIAGGAGNLADFSTLDLVGDWNYPASINLGGPGFDGQRLRQYTQRHAQLGRPAPDYAARFKRQHEQPIATNVADPNGLFLFHDAMTNAPQRFYRIEGL